MANLPKVARQVNALIDDLMGLAAGAMVLAVGIKMHRDGGSVGWLIAGTAALILNTLSVARRRAARRRRPTLSP
ncbi:hypothetical protein [Streptomyces sp. NBC_00316]|uniref:hypothetical protein n=1 Tax=Streptomyces sp. NBC_00316 TaxID=2975710 RepID=UPI002E27B03C|nr:hypothetical protein [Streptomyces sp. NBC_00316]